jgi:hypothetical protein
MPSDISVGCFQLNGDRWVLFTVAEYIGTRWVIRPMFGELLLSGNQPSNTTEATGLLDAVRTACQGSPASPSFHYSVRSAQYNIGVFYVPNPRLDGRHRQVLICGRTHHYNVFPAEFREPLSGEAATLFGRRNQSFPAFVPSFVDHPQHHASPPPADILHRYFRAAFDVRVAANAVDDKVMTVGWYAERDAVLKIVDTRDRKCNNLSECDILRALLIVRRTCWQPQNCGVIKYLASSLESHDAQLSVYTDWYALGDMYQSRFRFTVAECAGILLGALQGIGFINRTMAYLHNDIKPENVFVGIREGRCVGVIGDIVRGVPPNPSGVWLGGGGETGGEGGGGGRPAGDDAVVLQLCASREYTPVYTPCYGSRFSRCDVRRDQVALLLTILDSLTGKSWIGRCMSTLRAKKIDPTKMGFEFNPDGTSLNFEPSIIDAYANDIYNDEVLQPTTTDAHTRGGVWIRYLSLLTGKTNATGKDWVYDDFHRDIERALQNLKTSKIPRTPWPDGHGPRASLDHGRFDW